MSKFNLGEFDYSYDQMIRKFQTRLENTADFSETIQIFKEFYNYHHNIILKLGEWIEENDFLLEIHSNIINFERRFLNYHSISPVEANFQYLREPKFLSYNDPEFKLHAIAMQGRNELALSQDIYTDEEFKRMNLTNYCFESSMFVYGLCLAQNINAKMVQIEAGYNKDKPIYNGNGFHYFVWATLNEEHYIIDVTYSQFFLWQRNILNRLGLVGITGCDPGIFMYMDPKRKKVAETLLKNGFIKVTKESLKCYLDGFTLSFRNINYYEKTNNFSFQTPYTYEDYLRFLEREDDQIKHEGKENLGYNFNASPLIIEASDQIFKILKR